MRKNLMIILLLMSLVNIIFIISQGGVNAQTGALRVFSGLKSVYPAASDTGLSATDPIIIQNSGDFEIQVSIAHPAISPQELQGKIRVWLSEYNFILKPGDMKTVVVHIEVDPGAAVGLYNVTISISGSATDNGGGNPISFGQTLRTMILVGKYSYKLTVYLQQPDGSLTMGLIKVYYYFELKKSYIPMYQVKSANFTFRVIEGKYKIEAYLGGTKKASTEVVVDRNMVVNLTFSPIYIEDFVVLESPKAPYDSLIFSFTVKNDDPLIYYKEIEVTATLKNQSGILLYNQSLARLTVRSTVSKSIIGFVPPPEAWLNGTYIIQIDIYSKGKILYSLTEDVRVALISFVEVKQVEKLPREYVGASLFLGLLFGFFGAKYALLKISGKLKPKAVGLIYGKEYVAYNIYRKRFEDPMFISGEWSKVVYSYSILAAKYLKKTTSTAETTQQAQKDKKPALPKLVTVTLNAEKWIFVPIIQDIAYFLCVPSTLNEYDIREQIVKLKKYFKDKISVLGIHSLIFDYETALSDISKLVDKLF